MLQMVLIRHLKLRSASALAASACAATLLAPSAAFAQSTCERVGRLALDGPAQIQPAAGLPFDAKAAAILGGSLSALDRLRAEQEQNTTPVVPIVANDTLSCSKPVSASNLPAEPLSPPADAILGSIPVTIRRTPFDADWARLAARPRARTMQRDLSATGAKRTDSNAAKVEAVNRWVNGAIVYGEDREIYGRADYWAPATETLRRGAGDCEDFAIAKMELLAALGIGRDAMRLVVARDLVRNADHAVLVVMLESGAVMLDNMTDRLLDARLPNDYRPILSFSQNAKWVHGYAVQPAGSSPVRMAAARPEVQTVTAEPEFEPFPLALLSVPLALPSGLSARA